MNKKFLEEIREAQKKLQQHEAEVFALLSNPRLVLTESEIVHHVSRYSFFASDFPQEIPIKELDALWPTVGFLDNGLIVIDAEKIKVYGVIGLDKDNNYIYTMNYSGWFELIDKRNNVHGAVDLGRECLVTYFGSRNVAVDLAKSDFFDYLWEYDDIDCPKSCDSYVSRISSAIQHLNDDHDYSFEQISEWLNSLELKAKVLPVYSTNNKYFKEIFKNYEQLIAGFQSCPGSYSTNTYCW